MRLLIAVPGHDRDIAPDRTIIDLASKGVLMPLLLIGIGGFAGAVARYLVDGAIAADPIIIIER